MAQHRQRAQLHTNDVDLRLLWPENFQVYTYSPSSPLSQVAGDFLSKDTNQGYDWHFRDLGSRDKRETFLHLLDGDYVPGNILSVSHIFSHLLLVMTL